MKSIQTSIVLTVLAGLATCADVCQHKADRSKDPSGNPLRQPAVDTQVPRGDAYQIKWDPTTSGTVSIALLRGPSTNAEEFTCLANSIPNSGTFSWTPSTDLQIDTSRYGLKIIVDATGDYQFSAQFGIKKGDNEVAPSSSAAATSAAVSSTTSATIKSQSYLPTGHRKSHKPYHASGTGYTYRNATSSAYKTGGTTSKTTKASTTVPVSSSQTPSPSTSVAFVTGGGSGGSPGVSTQVVGVNGGAAGGATATATAQTPASTTPASFPKNSASGLKATSVLLGAVAAAMFYLM